MGKEEFNMSLALSRKAVFSVEQTPSIPSGIPALLVKNVKGRTKEKMKRKWLTTLTGGFDRQRRTVWIHDKLN
jgi:hypothetical protein